MDNAMKALIKFSDVEKRRMFTEDGELDPDDEAMRYCPVCKCNGIVNMRVSNQMKAGRNEDRLE